MLLSKKQLRYHLLAWGMFLLLVFIKAKAIDTNFIIRNLISFITLLFVFYMHLFIVFPMIGLKNSLPKVLSGSVSVIFLGIMFRQGVGGIFLPDSFSQEVFWVQFRLNLLFTVISLAYWFIVKNNDYKKMQLQSSMIESEWQLLNPQDNPPPFTELPGKISERNHFFVKTGVRNKLVKIDFSQIQYIESQSNYVIFHLDSDKIKTLASLKNIEAEMPSDQFIRIHSSFIIAKSIITGIEGNMMNTINKNLPIGAKYKKTVLYYIEQNTLQ
ncbi:LytTR family DNA-binding domain-containing protein [Emticicia sp. BO119]|uniref:LytR/AlgR family response regulator transcription factor n=1 Tax=Emticicia sp. BO119 TaxID=2757768 RepID=UPI0015F0638F|nr:LytTR family DNA-binding domain-containing protein [Emticicia sp. BO119]MBA4849523.1 LytTR family transcriptional regulator [Emticicia sp. BO119]